MNAKEVGSTESLLEHLIVLRCQAGDTDAFSRLHDKYREPLRRYVARLVSSDDVEDVVQEVWVTVYRRVAQLTNPGAFRQWVYRIARSKAFDALRRERRRSARQSAAAREASTTEEGRTMADVAEHGVEPAMAQLSREHREVLQLRYFEERSPPSSVAPSAPYGRGCTTRSRRSATCSPSLAGTAPGPGRRSPVIEAPTSREGSVQTIVDMEMKRDRLVRWVSVLSWVVTFLVLIGFAVVIGYDASRALGLARAGLAPRGVVLHSLVPMFVVVGTASLLLALVSTAAVFLRQRTASLADIQLRLATLEAMLARDANGVDER